MSTLVIQQALAELEDETGRLTPEAVVTAAKEPESPLHSHFEWDDAEAAAEHRLNQARTLIRSVRVEFRVEKRVIRSVAYVRDPAAGNKEQGYRSVAGIRKNEDDARSVLFAEFGSAAAHLSRARQISVALSLEEEVDALLEKLGILREAIASSAEVH